MMLAFVFLAMTALAVLAVLLPLSRRRQASEGGEAAVYRDQLAEIDRDRARGTIGTAEADAARIEVSRRLIAASEPVTAASSGARGLRMRRRIVAVLALAGLPLAATVIYVALGHPNLPDLPLSARTSADPRGETLDALMLRVEQELARRPEDGAGWDVVAPVYLRAGELEKAVTAYSNAIRLLGSSAARETGLGEALVISQKGKVVAEAKAAFERALALEPGNSRARFYLGRAEEQAGEPTKAADIYRQILADAPKDAPYIDTVRNALLGTALGEEGKAPAVDPKALDNVSADQRLATIRGMVEGLEARLKNGPRDLGGQLRLIRAWSMLGEPALARAAADQARSAFADDPSALRRISDLILGLGVEDKPA